MYRLRVLPNGLYQLHTLDGPAFEGTWLAITVAAQEVGLMEEELRFARDELDRQGHNRAEFGLNGTFLYTRSDLKSA